MSKMYKCAHNLRPRINGKAVLIKKGTPFDASILDAHTRKVFEDRGELTPVQPKEDIIDVVDEAEVKQKKSKKKAPKGIFSYKVEDLKEMELDDLDALHVELCAENSLTAPDPFESIEKAIEKLTSEA